MSNEKCVFMKIKKVIAIVEDDDAIATMYEYKLVASGYKVVRGSNGINGLDIAEKHRPDLILLDLKMPEMNGDEMLEKLRAKDWGTDIKVIVLTNLSKDEMPQSLRVLQVERVIIKSHYTPSQVLEVIVEVLT